MGEGVRHSWGPFGSPFFVRLDSDGDILYASAWSTSVLAVGCGAFSKLVRDAGKFYNVFMAPASKKQQWSKTHVDFDDFVRFFCNEFQWGRHVVSVRMGTMRRIDSFPSFSRR